MVAKNKKPVKKTKTKGAEVYSSPQQWTNVLLEQMRGEFNMVVDGLSVLSRKVDNLKSEFDEKLDEQFAPVRATLRSHGDILADLTRGMQRHETALHEQSKLIEQNSREIQKNSSDIQKNSSDIQKNSADIQKNSADIQKNSEDIQRLTAEMMHLNRILKTTEDESAIQAIERRLRVLEDRIGISN